MRKESEVYEFQDFALNKSALLGALQLIIEGMNGGDKPQKELIEETLKTACDKQITFTEADISNWGLGYWSGVLKTLNWVLGEDNDLLNIEEQKERNL